MLYIFVNSSSFILNNYLFTFDQNCYIRVITKLPNSEQFVRQDCSKVVFDVLNHIWICILIHKINVFTVLLLKKLGGLGVMVFSTSFNNISVISWLSVLLVGETGVLGENYWHAASHWQTSSHNVVSSTPHHKWISNSQR